MLHLFKYHFVFGLAEILKPRQRDFEQKFSADDREAYKSTPREETKITNEKSIVMEENRRVFILII